MQIRGLTKTTLLDYPEHVAATIFTGGCNFKCPFCHNGDLVLNPQIFPLLSEQEILSFLKKRKGILTGVCITGGEPTLQNNLDEFMKQIKDMGYLIKLDTNGYKPDVLCKLGNNKLMDYIAMDIKSGKNTYPLACSIANLDISRIESSVSYLQSCGIPYEFRTTAVKGIHTEKDFHDIGQWLCGNAKYYIQNYNESESVIEKRFESFSKTELTHFENIAKKYLPNTALRGIDD